MKTKARKPGSAKKAVDPRLTDEVYLEENESLIEEEFLFRPERMQRLPRGEFLRRHPGFDPQTIPTMVQVRIHLDPEVLRYFKARASLPNAAPYEALINQALREVMNSHPVISPEITSALLKDKNFIAAIAERVAEHARTRKPKTGRQTRRAA